MLEGNLFCFNLLSRDFPTNGIIPNSIVPWNELIHKTPTLPAIDVGSLMALRLPNKKTCIFVPGKECMGKKCRVEKTAIAG